ncbi:MAG: hypothetical protein AAF433_13185 [Bacteroidota bacterium]
MDAWTYDSKGFTNTELKKLDYVSNSEIKSYLDSSSHNKLFLVGPKGCGKTLLLHKKAYEYVEAQKKKEEEGRARNISDGLVENISFTGVRFSDSTLLELKDYDKWKDIWTFAIGLAALLKSGEELPPKLDRIIAEFSDYNAIRYMVPEILNKYEEHRRDRLFATYNNLIMSRVSKLQNRYFLFIDGLDQALDNLLTSRDYERAKEADPYIVYTIWRAAQAGLLYACFDMPTSHNRRLVVYATAREEALSISSQMAINLKSYCAYLRYTDDQLREIFKKNVKHTPSQNLYDTRSSHSGRRMLGFDQIAHVAAKELNGQPKVEDSIDLLLRHTFRRPREIVLLGKKIYSEFNANINGRLTDLGELKDATREVVNRSAYNDIFKSYVEEIFPTFREDLLKQFMEQVDANVITREQLEQLDSETVNYLYRVGLLGYVLNNKQKFAPPLTYIDAEEKVIPWSKYYVVHPVLDSKLQEKYDIDEFYSPYNIIGDGNDFAFPPLSLRALVEEFIVDDFLPDDLPGRTGNKWEQAKVMVDPKKLYTLIFKAPENIEIRRELLNRMEDAHSFFRQSLECWAINKLLLADDSNNFQLLEERRFRLYHGIDRLRERHLYETRIEDFSPKAQSAFVVRLFGRVSVLGMLLAMERSVPEAECWVRNFSAPKQTKDSESSRHNEVTYMRRSFFIAKLPESGAIDQGSVEKIWSKISPFERHLLGEWYHEAIGELLSVSGNFSERQRYYLEGKIKNMKLYKILTN